MIVRGKMMETMSIAIESQVNCKICLKSAGLREFFG